MKYEIVSKFLGRINSVNIYHESVYYSVLDILFKIKSKYGEVYDDSFISSLSSELDNKFLEEFSMDYFLEECLEIIENSSDFVEVKKYLNSALLLSFVI
ncbi:hypothetical protein STFE110948_03165 [Streptobacillus felis]|uniref:hypothetical protein n=1 Tax=Streptobacillus felis TaxID=1384509 RepID=UPI0008370AF6|nr:hypothetical protein [Streptobacillus felis]